jgi:hypothetical protein
VYLLPYYISREVLFIKCDAKCIIVLDEPLAAVMMAETEGFF